MSVCSGAFVLGAAGLLDSRHCTTHWIYTEELQRRYPLAKVDPDVLYVDDGEVLTSAGTAAGIDLPAARRAQSPGAAVANTARRMVVPPHRDGGQAQFVETPAGDRFGHAGRRTHLDGSAPRRGHGRRLAGGASAHVVTDVCPSIPRGDWHDAASVGHGAADPARAPIPRESSDTIDVVAERTALGRQRGCGITSRG